MLSKFFTFCALLKLIDCSKHAHHRQFCPAVTEESKWWNGNQWLECIAINSTTWTVIQKRTLSQESSINFNQNWNEYVTGFGNNRSPVITFNSSLQYWIGLRQISKMTKFSTSLRLELMLENGVLKFAEERSFIKYKHKFTLKFV
ncbi:Oidioi.mRNA.OKI2018_I69.XSR.g16120.t1.cds [Oikopleura dioica]|uniref:Oidioi.mRNA.OKI2018_I69.XSR.g16120.t1.cds n=1 Tax=Oikopleura dioica TaxID=34765 RepID=A0ABN7SF21_OIKDI|nr:Oidioi.mRNA.OKI2018_I69.XSR.g16120.t1.cds [Oikopleura dioica]